MKFIKFLLLGTLFGIVMAKSEAFSWFRIQEMFRFQSFHMYGIIGTAVILGAIGVALIKRYSIRDIKGNPITFFPKDKSTVRHLIGGTIFGLGWALNGACPDPMVVNIGYGYVAMIAVFLSAIIGTYLYGAIKDKIPHQIRIIIMENNLKADGSLAPVIGKLINIIILLLVFIASLIVVIAIYVPDFEATVKKEIDAPVPDAHGNFTEAGKQHALKPSDTTTYWIAPDIASIEQNPNKEMILYGQDLIVHTSNYYGENGKIFKSSTNGMNCQNCHLEAGTIVFGNNYSAAASTFPKYRARSGAIENMHKRINDCFERSSNGRALDTNSKEMQSIVAYMKRSGKDVAKGAKPKGPGSKDLVFLDRASDPEKGKAIYPEKCQSCHQQNGAGLMNGENTAFTYPPLRGDKSHNDGAGLYRMSNFAKFVKYNMPSGVSHNNTQLTDEETWDIAALVNSQPRPKKNTKNDWPKIEEKPFDHPFGHYADGFDEKQHKYGLFKPIKDKIASLKKK